MTEPVAAPEPETFRVPTELRVSPQAPRRLLVVGSCLVAGLIHEFGKHGPVAGDYVPFNNLGTLPPAPPSPLTEYDLQIVQIPLRSLLPDGLFSRLAYHRPEDHAEAFARARDALALFLGAAMRWNVESGLTTLVVGYFKPLQDPIGRLMPRNDLRNFGCFVDRLNDALSDMLAEYGQAYLLDVDAVAASIGRRYVQDEFLWPLNHNSTISDFDHAYDQGRLHPPAPVSTQHENRSPAFFAALYAEVEGMLRTLRQSDAVKLVVVDLDDTLWRGLAIEEGGFDGLALEGWPLGVIEALCILKARGILLAIASKNDEARIRAAWDGLFGGRIALEDFAVVKIDWRPKAETVAEIVRAVNVLPESVVFIDDNPAERFAVAQACPGIRTLGAELYDVRRVLLWSAETQSSRITQESGRRTEMVQAQGLRETARRTLSREAFLAGLDIRVEPVAIAGVEHPRFGRVLELINKTNQFNTTGERRSPEAMRAAFATGARIAAFAVADRFTDYGLVGACVVAGPRIEQVVMSCRVIGLDVEAAMLRAVLAELRQAGFAQVLGVHRDTGRNGLCAGLFADNGFRQEGEDWRMEL